MKITLIFMNICELIHFILKNKSNEQSVLVIEILGNSYKLSIITKNTCIIIDIS